MQMVIYVSTNQRIESYILKVSISIRIMVILQCLMFVWLTDSSCSIYSIP